MDAFLDRYNHDWFGKIAEKSKATKRYPQSSAGTRSEISIKGEREKPNSARMKRMTWRREFKGVRSGIGLSLSTTIGDALDISKWNSVRLFSHPNHPRTRCFWYRCTVSPVHSVSLGNRNLNIHINRDHTMRLNFNPI